MKKGALKHIVLVLMLLTGCQDIENCDADENYEFMIIDFYDLSTQEEKQVGFEVSTPFESYGFSTYSDDSTSLALYLNPADTTATFYFDSDTLDQFTLQVSYQKQFSIFDPECPASVAYTSLDTVAQTFDSTVVVGTITNAQIGTNVEIYF